MTFTKPLIVGIAGGTGSGKSTVAHRIAKSLPEGTVSVLDHDAYYHDHSDVPMAGRELLNYDHPSALDNDLLIADLDRLREGQVTDTPIYDFCTHARSATTRRVWPTPIIVLEGILIFADRRLRQRLDIKLFVDTDPDVRLFRRIRRDIQSRGRTFKQVNKTYFCNVRPMHQKFVEPSKRWADLIIPEGGNNKVALDLVVNKLRSVAEQASVMLGQSHAAQPLEDVHGALVATPTETAHTPRPD